MNLSKIWRKTYRTMIQTLIPFIPINVAMLDSLDPKVVAVEVLGAGLVCFLMGFLDDDNRGGGIEDDEDLEDYDGL